MMRTIDWDRQAELVKSAYAPLEELCKTFKAAHTLFDYEISQGVRPPDITLVAYFSGRKSAQHLVESGHEYALNIADDEMVMDWGCQLGKFVALHGLKCNTYRHFYRFRYHLWPDPEKEEGK